MKIAVIADDFTGANDIGIRFRDYGLNVISTFVLDENNTDVCVISTESRNEDPEIAHDFVENVFKKMKENGFDKFYKKIDSTLRGNIKSELDALIKQLKQEEVILFIVGFPDTGRQVINGKHFVNNIPLHESDYAKDPIKPVLTNDILTIIGENGILVTLEEIRGELGKILACKLKCKNQVLIFDTETNEDLEKIAKTAVELEIDKYIAGSSAIMKYLPKYWKISKERVIIISGSCNEHNIKQLEAFIKVSDVDVFEIDVKNFDKSEIDRICKSKKDIVIRTITDKGEMQKVLEYYKERGYEAKEAGEIISKNIGEIAGTVIKRLEINKIIIAGGETTKKVLEECDIKGLYLQYEIDTGIPLTYSLNLNYSIITKPGGFGKKNIFFRCYEIFKNAENRFRNEKN